MIVLDDLAKGFYDYFYSDTNSLDVFNSANDMISKVDRELLTVGINVFRTAATLGMSFESYHGEAAVRLQYIVNDLNLFVFNIAFCEIYNLEYQILEKFFGYKFKQRDFYAEIAENLYGVANEETIEKIKAPERHYSVDKPTPESWDRWFYNMCLEVAANSKCFSRKIGSVLVKDKSIISTGYNGPPRGVPTCDKRWRIDPKFYTKYAKEYAEFLKDGKSSEGVCPRRIIGFPSGQGLEICPAGHAERNALINAARHGIRVKGMSDEPTTLYMSCGVPCSPCLVEIINAGVSEIVVTGISLYDATAEYLLQNSNLKIRLFSFLK